MELVRFHSSSCKLLSLYFVVKLVGSKERSSRVESWCHLRVVKNTTTFKLGSMGSNLTILDVTIFIRLYVGLNLYNYNHLFTIG